MSDQNPPGAPAERPDPFDELLRGLREEPADPLATPAQPVHAVEPGADPGVPDFPPVIPAAAPVAPAEPAEPAEPADVPTVAYTPEQPTVAFTPDPTVPFEPGAAEELPPPIPAAEPAYYPPTVALPGTFEPTAATTVIGGSGGVPPQGPPAGGGGFRDWDPRRKALFFTLLAVAGALLIALIVAIVVFATQGQPQPDPTTGPRPTNSTTPSPRPSTPTPTPTPTVKPGITAFAVNPATAVCPNINAGTTVPVGLSWTIVGTPAATAIQSGNQAVDAIDNPYQNALPASATNFPMTFPCDQGQWFYSLTIADEAGEHFSNVVPVVRSYTPPPPPPPAAPAVSSFTATPEIVSCPDPSATPTVTFSWSTSNATSVTISGVPGTFGASGSTTVTYDCAQPQIMYTLTATGASGTTPATADDVVSRDTNGDSMPD